MKLIRYKTLSQFIDVQNLYVSMELLAEVFLFGEEYFTFMKKKSSNEVQMSKETFAGGFKVTKIPFQTWGITVNQFELLKSYSFNSVNFICAKVNTEQYVSIVIDAADRVAIYIDNTNDTLATNFIRSSCPLICVSSESNQSIYSFNNLNDGTDSAILYDTSIDWTGWNSTNATKLSSILASTNTSTEIFNALIVDPSSSNLWVYSMVSGSPSVYSISLTQLKNAIFNQVTNDSSAILEFDSSSLLDYVSMDLSNSLVLVNFNNNSLIYFNESTKVYTYKNLFAHYSMVGFDSAGIFDSTKTRFNIFKQMLITFNDITDVDHYKLSKALIDSNLFMLCESNLNTVNKTNRKAATATYFSDVPESRDLIEVTTGDCISSIDIANYIMR